MYTVTALFRSHYVFFFHFESEIVLHLVYSLQFSKYSSRVSNLIKLHLCNAYIKPRKMHINTLYCGAHV
jgi:hypothetical protein